jgi:hypothetical protein
VDKVSIRGLSPEFSGVLLNGREMVSSNDSRAVPEAAPPLTAVRKQIPRYRKPPRR